jgi:hypothetical protein
MYKDNPDLAASYIYNRKVIWASMNKESLESVSEFHIPHTFLYISGRILKSIQRLVIKVQTLWQNIINK